MEKQVAWVQGLATSQLQHLRQKSIHFVGPLFPLPLQAGMVCIWLVACTMGPQALQRLLGTMAITIILLSQQRGSVNCIDCALPVLLLAIGLHSLGLLVHLVLSASTKFTVSCCFLITMFVQLPCSFVAMKIKGLSTEQVQQEQWQRLLPIQVPTCLSLNGHKGSSAFSWCQVPSSFPVSTSHGSLHPIMTKLSSRAGESESPSSNSLQASKKAYSMYLGLNPYMGLLAFASTSPSVRGLLMISLAKALELVM